MASTVLAETDARSTNNTSVTTSAIDTTGCDILILAVVDDNASPAAPTDSKGNTWTAATRYKTSAQGVRFYYCIGGTVGSSHTFTFTPGGTNYPAIGMIGASCDGTPTYDAENGANTSQTTGNVTPSASGALVITGQGNSDSNAVTGASGFTITAALPANANAYGVGMAYVVHTSGAIGATWTQGGSNTKCSNIIAFVESGGGGGNRRRRLLIGA